MWLPKKTIYIADIFLKIQSGQFCISEYVSKYPMQQKRDFLGITKYEVMYIYFFPASRRIT